MIKAGARAGLWLIYRNQDAFFFFYDVWFLWIFQHCLLEQFIIKTPNDIESLLYIKPLCIFPPEML